MITKRTGATILLTLTLVVGGSVLVLGGLNRAYSERTAVVAPPVSQEPAKPSDKPDTAPLPLPVKPAVPVISGTRETQLGLKVLDRQVDMAGSPILAGEDGKLMLPLRKLGEALGYTVKWDDTLRAAVLQKGTETLTVKNNSLDYSWGSVPKKFSKKVEMHNFRLYVPSDFITSGTAYTLSQTSTQVVIEASGKEVKNVVTGSVEDITVFSNGLGIRVTEKNIPVTLYISDDTRIADYTTGAALETKELKVGTKAIFSYTVVTGEDGKHYNLLNTVEVVGDAVKKTAP